MKTLPESSYLRFELDSAIAEARAVIGNQTPLNGLKIELCTNAPPRADCRLRTDKYRLYTIERIKNTWKLSEHPPTQRRNAPKFYYTAEQEQAAKVKARIEDVKAQKKTEKETALKLKAQKKKTKPQTEAQKFAALTAQAQNKLNEAKQAQINAAKARKAEGQRNRLAKQKQAATELY